MSSYMEFDIKHEEDPLTITEIKSEPQDSSFAGEAEFEESKKFHEHVDIKDEVKPTPQLVATIKTSEVEETQENILKLMEDNEKILQEEQNNTEDEINGLLLVNESYESYGIDSQEEKCKMSVCVQTGVNVNSFPEFNNFGFCNKDFSNESIYTPRVYANPCEKCYTCHFCTKTFTCKCHVIGKVCTYKSEKPIICDVCCKSLALKSHTRTYTNRLSTCIMCRKSFSRKSDLASHIRTHTKEKPFTCTICKNSFAHKSNLAKHMRTHTNEKPFTCTICMNSFSQKSNLVTHIRIHTNEKPFKCTICMNSFSCKSNLITHVRTHTNEKPFTCTICRNSFSQKSTLESHIRTHTNEKPFKCSICTKSFCQKSALETHMYTHKNEKPFKCTICMNSFVRKSVLAKHTCTR